MNEMNTDSLVSIRNLTKKFRKKTALDNISLDLPKGRIIGLLGPNGSGKTTLIKLMNGLLVPTRGQIVIAGNFPGVETKACVSYLPERSYLPDNIRVSQLLSYFTDFYEDFDRQKALSMLDSLKISIDSPLKTLSKGTKEKVQLIMVMSRRASLYILDEPIAGVDPAARDYILKTIIQDYNEEATILLSTHLIADIETILDDVIFIRDGHVTLTSSVEDIRTNYNKSVDAYFREVFAC
ncbi:MAG: ABC transporter ATP-binding protein [Eubacteriales bacterium]|nr:ABC transporter ATP-binding protein [Eubacteriales bacterium]